MSPFARTAAAAAFVVIVAGCDVDAAVSPSSTATANPSAAAAYSGQNRGSNMGVTRWTRVSDDAVSPAPTPDN